MIDTLRVPGQDGCGAFRRALVPVSFSVAIVAATSDRKVSPDSIILPRRLRSPARLVVHVVRATCSLRPRIRSMMKEH
jgi:hypothetical protein